MENTRMLTIEETELLGKIAEAKRYALVQFELGSSKDTSLRSIALRNVHIVEEDESMQIVKARGAVLQRLSDEGYIILDFHPAVHVASDYAIYSKSAIYMQLCEMAEEAKTKPGFLYDSPCIRKGSVVLTAKGRKATL